VAGVKRERSPSTAVASNWLVAGIILTLLSVAYACRMKSEESMLLTAFGEKYRDYMASTWRLVPWVF
jgi:protein-S-isoprenylcysteine O-methyltransferase Ste14